jgi:hypothetical protein
VAGTLLHGTRFADVEVLAKLAAKVAARGSERKNCRAGIKMKEWFLLDGINGHRGGASIALLNQCAVNVLTDIAKAVLSGSDVAVPGT